MRDRVKGVADCNGLSSPRLLDSDKELRNTAEARASRAEMSDILNTTSATLRRQEERQAGQLESNEGFMLLWPL